MGLCETTVRGVQVTVSTGSAETLARKKCFVLSPIGEDGSPERLAADKVLKHLIRKSLGHDYDVQRADEETDPGAITPSIIKGITQADLIVADLSGLNPNVFYELAIAHGYQRPTVHIQHVGGHVPFDVKDMRVIRYNIADPDELESAQRKLRDFADHVAANPGKVVTPLSSAERFATVASSTDPVAESNVRVVQAINDLTAHVKRALARPQVSYGGSPGGVSRAADHQSLRRIVARAAGAARLQPSDFVDSINEVTSTEYDGWLREILSIVVGGAHSNRELNSVLMTDDLLNRAEDATDDFDVLDAAADGPFEDFDEDNDFHRGRRL